MKEEIFSDFYRKGKIVSRLSFLITLVKVSKNKKEKLARRKRRKRFFVLANYYYYKSAEFSKVLIEISKPN